MAGLDNISIEEFKRVMAEAVLEGQRLAMQGAGPSTGQGLGGSLDLGDVSKEASNAGAMLKQMQQRIATTNKGMLAYQQVMRGAELTTVTFGDSLKDIDKEIARLAVSTNAAEQAEAVRLQGMRDETRQQAMKSQVTASTINATMKLGQVISGTVLPGMFNVARGLNDGADAADIAGSALTAVIDSVEGSVKALTTTMAEAGKGLQSLGGTAGKVGGVMMALAPIIEMLVGSGAKLAKEMMALSTTAYKRNADMFNTLTQSGAMFADGIEGMRKGAYDAGMTTEQFSRVVQKNSATFAAAGLGVTEATKLMGSAMRAGGKDMKRDMLAMGYSFEEQSELMAEVMATMRGSGGALGPQDNAAIAQETARYAENLKLISSITGEDAKAKRKQAQEAANNLAFQQKLAGMDKAERIKIQAAMENMTAQEQKNFMDRMLFGQVINKEGAILEQTSTAMQQKGAEAARLAEQGLLDGQKTIQMNAQYGERIKQDLMNATELAQAAYANQGALSGVVSGAMDSVKQAQAYTQESVDLAKSNLEGQKNQAKDPDTRTGKMVANMQKAQDILVKQQKITDQLADEYSKVIEQTLKGVEDLQTKVEEFVKMSPAAIAGALEKAEWATKIITAITGLTAIMFAVKGLLARRGGDGPDGGDRGRRRGRGRGGRIGRLLGGAKNLVAGGARAGGAAGGALLKGGLRAAAGAAKLIPGVGLAVTAAMGIFDGMTAGIEEYKKSGKIGAAVREGMAGAVSGLTFGIIDQETVSDGLKAVGGWAEKQFSNVTAGWDEWKKSGDIGKAVKAQASGLLSSMTFGMVSKETIGEGLDTIGEWTSKGWKSLKENVDLGAIKGKVSSIAKSVTGAVGNFFGGLFGGSEKEAKKDTASDATKDPRQAKIEALKEQIKGLKGELSGSYFFESSRKEDEAKLKELQQQLNQLSPTATTSGTPVSNATPTQTGKPLEDAKQAEVAMQAEEAKKKADAEIAIKEEAKKKEMTERLASLSPQERTNELLTQVVALLTDSAGSQRILARNTF